MTDIAQFDPSKLDQLSLEQLRELTRTLLVRTEHDSREIVWRDAKIDKLTFEIAQLRRMKFDRSSEQMSAEQRALFDEAVDGDIAAIDEQLAALQATLPPKPDDEKKQPKRRALPEGLPRRDVRHEPEDTTCGCGQALQRIGEDVSEKLDYTPGVFTVERHVRGKWCCAGCRTLVQAPVPPAVIDKGIPTAGLLAHVLVAKHADHLPLYRQEAIFGRAGLAIPRATLGAWLGQCGARLEPVAQALKAELLRCQVLHADETPVAMLAPGRGKTQRAYLWAYAAARSEPIKAVVYDFTPGRSGEHARVFLGHDPERGERDRHPWTGQLVCDDFSGYKALFELGVTEVGGSTDQARWWPRAALRGVLDGSARLYIHALDLQQIDLGVNHGDEALEPLHHIHCLEQALLFLELDAEMCGHRVGEPTGFIDRGERPHDLCRDLLVELHVLLELPEHGAHQHFGTAAVSLTRLEQFETRGEVPIRLPG